MSVDTRKSFTDIIKEQSRIVVPIVFVLIFSSTALGIQRTVLSVYSQEIDTVFVNYLILSSAIALSSFGISKAIGNYLAGILSDQIGRRISMVIGMGALIFGSIFIVLIQQLISLYIGNFLLGLGIGILFATSSISLTDIATANHRAKAVSMMELSVYGGTSVGAILAGTAFDSNDVSLPFIIALILVSIIILTIPFLKDTKYIAKKEQKEVAQEEIFEKLKDVARSDWTKYYSNIDSSQLSEDLNLLINEFINDNLAEHRFQFTKEKRKRKSLSFLLTYTTGVVSHISDTAIILIFPLLVIELGFADYRLGIATSAFTIAWAIGIAFTGPISDKVGRKSPLIFGLSLEAFGLLFFYIPLISNNFIIIIFGTLIAGFGRGIYYPIPTSMITDFVEPEERGKSLGNYRFFLDFGYVIGSVLLVLIIEPLARSNDSSLLQVFHTGFIVVIMIIIIQVILSTLFLKDPKPGFSQYPRIRKHYNTVSSAFFFLISSIVAFSEKDIDMSRKNLVLTKIEEQQADEVLQELTQISYTGATRAPDVMELLNFSTKVDKALSDSLRGVRKLLLIDQEIPKSILKRLAQYSFILGYLLETLDISLTYLPTRMELAANTTYQTNLVEELLDEINKLLWNDIIYHKEKFDPFNLVLLKEVLESLEKSSNTIEDAAEIIRLINFKHVI